MMYESSAWSRKEKLCGLLAVVSFGALIFCFSWLYTAYDGAVRSNAAYFLVYLGAQSASAFLSFIPPKPNPHSVPYRLYGLLGICMCAVIAGAAVKTPMYLSPIHLTLFQLYGALIPLAAILLYGRRKGRAIALDSLSRRLLFSAGNCLYLIATIFLYLAVFQPLPLREAKAIAAPYGMGYVYHAADLRGQHPLGLYCFSDHGQHANPEEYTYLYIDVLTHNIVPPPWE